MPAATTSSTASQRREYRVRRPLQRPPVHPGELMREILEDHVNMTISEAARRMKVSRQSLHAVLNGKSAVTADMALRFARLTSGAPELYLDMQVGHDLEAAKERLQDELADIEPPPQHRPSAAILTGKTGHDQAIDPWRAQQSTGTRLVLVDTSTLVGLRHAVGCGAGEFYNAARRVTPTDSAPQYVLIFHAIELALKAFLIGKGFTTAQLKKRAFSNDLVQLYETAERHGLRLSVADADKFLAWANEYHDRNALIRYDFTETRTLPMAETLFPIVDALIGAGK